MNLFLINTLNSQNDLNQVNAYLASQKQQAAPPPPPTPQGGGESNPVFNTGGAYPWDKYQALQENLANIEANALISSTGIKADADKQIAQSSVNAAALKAEADKEVAKAYADAQKYGSELGLQATKYASDVESQYKQAIANIEVKGKLDLQPIINAGLQKVADIDAASKLGVAKTTGEYNLKSVQEQTKSAEKIGKMELAGTMYGLLGSMFG